MKLISTATGSAKAAPPQGRLIVTGRGLFSARQLRAAVHGALRQVPYRVRSAGFEFVYRLEAAMPAEALARRVWHACVERIGHLTAVMDEVPSTAWPIRKAAVGTALRAIEPAESFCFRLHKRGTHELSADTPELEAEIGGAIAAALERRDARPASVDLEFPDVIVTAEVLGPRTALGIFRNRWKLSPDTPQEDSMSSENTSHQTPAEAEAKRESGLPGGGAGRRDEVGGSGVYPASAGYAPADAVIRTPAAWGQGERGGAGYEDSGPSELFFYPAELEAMGIETAAPGQEPGQEEEPNRQEPRLRRVGGTMDAIDENLLHHREDAAALKRRIEAALVENTEVHLDDVVVEVIGREVTLGGVVRSAEERDDVEWAVWSVPGVGAVANRLRVEAPRDA
jgi:tRNA(Ser,Leu) C12 N-acetylase TAN1